MSDEALQRFQETESPGRFALQNPQLLKARLDGDNIQARSGSMVAYQGDLRFEYQGGGLGRLFKKAVTGEGVRLMSVSGSGDLFLAHDARQIIIQELHGDQMTVNGDNIVAFDAGIDWDVRRVEGAGMFAGGLFNVVLEGSGMVALSAYGEPVLLDVGEAPTFADPQSAIAWSGGVSTNLKRDMSAKTFTGRSSGETFQVGFSGAGWVLVQASEGAPEAEDSEGGGGGGFLSDMLGE